MVLNPQIKEKEIVIVKNFPDDPLLTKAHEGSIIQVLCNLLQNAVLAVEQFGTIEISASLKENKLWICRKLQWFLSF